MATISDRVSTLEAKVRALETWKTAHLTGHVLSGHTHPTDATDADVAALDARIDALEVVPTPTPEPVPVPPPPPAPTPPPIGALPPETTLTYRTWQPVPALPPRGVIYDDPNGTKAMRIGDAGQGPLYSKRNIENADGTILFFAYSGTFWKRDGSGIWQILPGGPGNLGNFNWDPVDPKKGYSTSNGSANLTVWDFTNPSSAVGSTLKSFGEAITLTAEGVIADDGTFAIVSSARAGYVRVFNWHTGYDSGWWNSGVLPDSFTMSRNGLYVVANVEPSSIRAYNPDGSNGHQVAPEGRHGDTAVDVWGNQVWVGASGRMWRLDQTNGPVTNLFPAGHSFDSSHVAGHTIPGWAGFSEMNPQDNIGKLGNGQAVLVKLDGSKTVRVYGFTYSTGALGDDGKQPQVAWSRDGRYAFGKANRNGGTYGWTWGVTV